MFADIPENYRSQTASDEEEGWRYTQGDKSARRPPELLTRDHVARCIRREVREGRGSPHGGVFLDISWISKKLQNAEEHIKRKLPSMYHQFKELADIDITKEPMEVGPTTHYVMGGVLVDADTQMSSVPGLFAAGECAAGHQRRQPPGRQLALGPAGVRQARRRPRRRVHPRRGSPAARARRRAGRGRGARGAGAVRPARRRAALCRPARPAGADAGQRRHRADRERDVARARGDRRRCARAPRAPASPAIATTIPAGTPRSTSQNLLDVAEAVTRSALERAESRGGHYREDFPEQGRRVGQKNVCVQRGAGRRDAAVAPTHRRDAGRAARGSSRRTSEDMATTRPSGSGVATRAAATFQDYQHRDLRGHGRARRRPPRAGRAGERSGVPVELQGRQVRLVLGGDQRPAAAHVHDAPELAAARPAGDDRAHARVPA